MVESRSVGTRTCQLLDAQQNLSLVLLALWKDITTLVKIEEKRTIGNKTSIESRL